MYIRKVTFRDAEVPDAEQMEKIEQKCFEEVMQWDKAAFEEELNTPWNRTRLIEVDGEMAGFVMLELHDDKPGYVSTLDIAPEYRHNGYGNCLMEWAEIATKQSGRNEIRLHVSTRNIPAYKIYFARGYRTCKFEPEFYANGEDALEMRKLL